MTPANAAELQNIRARQAYGIHRNSDYNREYELTRTRWTRVWEFLFLAGIIGLTAAKYGAMIFMAFG